MSLDMSHFSISRLAVAALRATKQIWPLKAGRDWPNRVGGIAARIGVLKPFWYEFEAGLWMKLNIQELIHETILLEGLWDPQLTQLVKSRLSPGQVFIDIGAHSGYFTLLAAKRVCSDGKVIAVEPNPAIVKQLEGNVGETQLTNVVIEQVACSDGTGAAVLYLHDDSNSSMSSLSQTNIPSSISVKVNCVTLDMLVKKNKVSRVDLIKIDVEGAEWSVLRGAEQTIRTMKPTIVLELDPHLLDGFGRSVDDVLNQFRLWRYQVKPLGGHSNYICEPMTADGVV